MPTLQTPADLKYAKTDEWLRLEGDTATIGISDYAQDQLNDIVFVELLPVGTALKKGDRFGTVESVKAASDVYMPVSATITEVNQGVIDQTEIINSDPYGRGWLIRISVDDAGEAADLMDSAAYEAYNATR